jgi:hypothetical protein
VVNISKAKVTKVESGGYYVGLREERPRERGQLGQGMRKKSLSQSGVFKYVTERWLER